MVDNISGHHEVLRDIRCIRQNYPWFHPPPESKNEEEEVEVRGEEKEYNNDMEGSLTNTSDGLNHTIVHQNNCQAI